MDKIFPNSGGCVELSDLKKSLGDKSFFYEITQKHALIGSYIYNITNNIWESSEILDNIFGIDNSYKKDYNSWTALVHAEDKIEMDKYAKEHIFKDKNSFEKEYKIVRQNDGEVRWVYSIGHIFYSKENNDVILVGTVQDITDMKAIKLKSNTNLKKFKDLIAATKMAYFILGTDGLIKETNESFLDMIGNKNEDSYKLEGFTIFNLVSGEDSNRIRKGIMLLEKGIAIEELEICMENKSSEKRGTWIRLNANIMENGERNIICLAKDITSKKIEEFQKFINHQKQKDMIKQSIIKLRNKIVSIKNKE